MAVIFNEYSTLKGDKYLVVENKNISEYINYFNVSGAYQGVVVNHRRGYDDADISFVKDLDNLQGLILVDDDTDTSILNELPNLKFLQAEKINSILDFSLLPSLEVYRGDWSTKLKNLNQAMSLTDLYLCGFKPKTTGLSDICLIPQLKNLELVQGNIDNLTGVEKLVELEFLGLYYQRNLKDLSALENCPGKLNKIHFESCKNITDYAALAGCKNLTALNIEKSAAIEDVRFIHELKKLKDFLFINTPMDKRLYVQLHTPSLRKVVNTKADYLFNYDAASANTGVAKADENSDSAISTEEMLRQRTAIALAAIKTIFGTEEDEYGAMAFVQHHLDELEPDYWKKLLGTEAPEPADVLNCLVLVSHWDNDLVLDFSLPESVTDYVISVRFDQDGNPADISMES